MADTEQAELAQEISDAFWRIEGNYHRETSGPGSRFEGKELTLVQAEWVLNHLSLWGYRKAPATPDTGQREHAGTEWGLRQAGGWVAHMHDRPDAEETQKLHPDAVLVCRYVGQWSELEPSAAQAPAASNPELEALRAKLRQAPAASEQPAPSVLQVPPSLGATDASEDTIEQARAVASDALQHTSVGGMHADADATKVVTALAARGLLADGTDRRRIEKALALHQREDEGMGYGSDDDDTPGSYGTIHNVCTTCGTADEYAVRWPCPTVAALTDTEGLAALTGGQP
jgi:hypothetical protein